jgi:glycosyltransferase involved in cell wall biosynthesis
VKENLPLVSIITATLNAAAQLPHTLRSIGEQQGASFEWIILDGGSTDGTLDLLRKSAGLVSAWRSEPDTGIYDAWNKGCKAARGDWLLFLGAGDSVASPDVLAEFSLILSSAYPAHDLVYGRLRNVSPLERRDLDEVGAPWAELRGRWELCRPALPPHGATFHHRSLFEGGRRFDPRFRVAGDSHFLLRYAMGKPPLHVPALLVRSPTHGVSMRLRGAVALAREIRRIGRELGLVPPLGHRIAENLLLVAKFCAGCLPAPIGNRLADAYRRLRGWPARWSAR